MRTHLFSDREGAREALLLAELRLLRAEREARRTAEDAGYAAEVQADPDSYVDCAEPIENAETLDAEAQQELRRARGALVRARRAFASADKQWRRWLLRGVSNLTLNSHIDYDWDAEAHVQLGVALGVEGAS